MPEKPCRKLFPLPGWITDADRKASFAYIDELRKSGETNMLGARTYLEDKFYELGRDDAAAVLTEWMTTFAERHP